MAFLAVHQAPRSISSWQRLQAAVSFDAEAGEGGVFAEVVGIRSGRGGVLCVGTSRCFALRGGDGGPLRSLSVPRPGVAACIGRLRRRPIPTDPWFSARELCEGKEIADRVLGALDDEKERKSGKPPSATRGYNAGWAPFTTDLRREPWRLLSCNIESFP